MAGERQRTLLGILTLLLAPVPVLGVVVAKLVERATPQDTNANTMAMIAGILSLWIGTPVGLVALAILLVCLYPPGG